MHRMRDAKQSGLWNYCAKIWVGMMELKNPIGDLQERLRFVTKLLHILILEYDQSNAP